MLCTHQSSHVIAFIKCSMNGKWMGKFGLNVITSAMASEITGISTAWSAICSGANQRKHQNPVSLAFVRGIRRWPMNSLHKRPVTHKMFPFDDVIMSKHIAPVLQMPDYAVPLDGLFMQFKDSFDLKISQCRGSDSSWLCDTAFVSTDLN